MMSHVILDRTKVRCRVRIFFFFLNIVCVKLSFCVLGESQGRTTHHNQTECAHTYNLHQNSSYACFGLGDFGLFFHRSS